MKDITGETRFEDNDGESLPITQCACGKKFAPWIFHVSIYKNDPNVCPACNRRIIFSNRITIWELEEGE